MADAATWAAFGLAAYGGVLSTYNVIVRRRDRHAALRRDVRVTGFMRPHPQDATEVLHTITVANRTTRPIGIARVGVVLGNGTGVWYGPPPPNLPAHLADGQSVTVDIAEEWFQLIRDTTQQEIVGLAAEDSLGQVYRSESA